MSGTVRGSCRSRHREAKWNEKHLGFKGEESLTNREINTKTHLRVYTVSDPLPDSDI